MAETKRKSVRETLKELGAETMPRKGNSDLKGEMKKMPRDLENEKPLEITKLKKGGSTSKWIQEAVKKPGALKKSLGVKKGEKIPASKLAAAAKKPGKMGQRARLAQTLKGLKK